MKRTMKNIRCLSVKDLPAPNAINDALSGRGKMNSKKSDNERPLLPIRNLGDLKKSPQDR